MYKKILIVKPSSLGDIVHTLPLVNSLKASLPDAIIDWVIARGFDDLLDGHPLINRRFIINKDSWKSLKNLPATLSELLQLGKELRKQRYDLCIDVQGLLRSGLISAISGASTRLGFSDAREGASIFYNLKVEGGKGLHAVDRYLKLLKPLRIHPGSIEFPLPHIKTKRVVKGKYYILVPGARWRTKQWPPEYFSELIRLLSGKAPFADFVPVVVGTKSDSPIAKDILSKSPVKGIDLTGKTTLKELVSFIKGANFVVTNDSGPMHLAAAVQTQVFAIFGPTSAQLTGPYGEGHIVISAGLKCQPCFRRNCEDVRCMTQLKPQEVYERIVKYCYCRFEEPDKNQDLGYNSI